MKIQIDEKIDLKNKEIMFDSHIIRRGKNSATRYLLLPTRLFSVNKLNKDKIENKIPVKIILLNKGIYVRLK